MTRFAPALLIQDFKNHDYLKARLLECSDPTRSIALGIDSYSDPDELPQRSSMPSSNQGASVLVDTQDHQCIGVVRRQELVASFWMLPRCPQFPLLELKSRGAYAALAIVAKISAGMGVLESEIAILLDAEPVRIQMTCAAEVVKLWLISDESDSPATLLLDGLESIFGPGNSSGTAPEALRAFGRGWRGVHLNGGG